MNIKNRNQGQLLDYYNNDLTSYNKCSYKIFDNNQWKYKEYSTSSQSVIQININNIDYNLSNITHNIILPSDHDTITIKHNEGGDVLYYKFEDNVEYYPLSILHTHLKKYDKLDDKCILYIYNISTNTIDSFYIK